MGPDTIAATDPALTVLPDGARLRTTQTGYPLLTAGGELTDALRRFLAAGPPPIYAGFGSMPYGDRRHMGKLLVEAAERAGERVVIYRGWARIPEVGRSDACLFVGEEPHGVLFPRIRAVIHHRAPGRSRRPLTLASRRSCCRRLPTSSWWRGQVVRLGLGPRAPMLRAASAASVARAITAALTDPAYRQRAQDMASRLRAAPDGVTTTVAEITRSTAVEA